MPLRSSLSIFHGSFAQPRTNVLFQPSQCLGSFRSLQTSCMFIHHARSLQKKRCSLLHPPRPSRKCSSSLTSTWILSRCSRKMRVRSCAFHGGFASIPSCQRSSSTGGRPGQLSLACCGAPPGSRRRLVSDVLWHRFDWRPLRSGSVPDHFWYCLDWRHLHVRFGFLGLITPICHWRCAFQRQKGFLTQ